MAEKRSDGTTRGGQEPRDQVQDRPEQNAGYDAVARGEDRNARRLDEDFVAVQDDPAAPEGSDDLDDRAARDAAAVRRPRAVRRLSIVVQPGDAAGEDLHRADGARPVPVPAARLAGGDPARRVRARPAALDEPDALEHQLPLLRAARASSYDRRG